MKFNELADVVSVTPVTVVCVVVGFLDYFTASVVFEWTKLLTRLFFMKVCSLGEGFDTDETDSAADS